MSWVLYILSNVSNDVQNREIHKYTPGNVMIRLVGSQRTRLYITTINFGSLSARPGAEQFIPPEGLWTFSQSPRDTLTRNAGSGGGV